jgi:hypothetical protein
MALRWIYRGTLALAVINFLAFAAVAIVYYAIARPEFADAAAWRQVEATLRDPNTSAETLRTIALNMHGLVAGTAETYDIAIEAFMYGCGSTSLCLALVGLSLRKYVKAEFRAL